MVGMDARILHRSRMKSRRGSILSSDTFLMVRHEVDKKLNALPFL